MKNNILKLKLLLIILICNTALSQAQTEYGDGTMRLKSYLNLDWDKTKGMWVPNDSTTFKYLYQDKMTQLLRLFYNSTTTVYNPFKEEYNVYDKDGFITLHVDSFIFSSHLDFRIREEFTKNSKGQVKNTITHHWNTSNNAWNPFSRASYTYHSNNQVLTKIFEYYDKNLNQYNLYMLDSFVFNNQNKIIKQLTFLWNKGLGAWKEYKRFTYTYNNAGSETSKLEEEFSFNAWNNSRKTEQLYNAKNQPTIFTSYKWNTGLNSWQYISTHSIEYDTIDLSQTQIYQLWNTTTNVWDNSDKYIYKYDSNGRNYQKLSYTWNATYKAWDNYTRWEKTYNNHGYNTFYAYDVWDNFSKVWKPAEQIFYRYDDYSSVKNMEHNYRFNVFPNPAHDQITIQSGQALSGQSHLILTDIQGKNVANFGYLNAASEWNLNLGQFALPNGIYFLKISHSDFQKTIPIILGN